MKYYKREIEPQIKKAIKQFPVVALTGPRQSGKSTLLKKLFPKFEYYSFDDPGLLAQAKADPALFIESLSMPVILDEIQYIPEILPYIKIWVDQRRDQKGQFALTGSQIFHLMAGISETLAGRIALFELLPFSVAEIGAEYEMPLKSLFKIFHKGFYPDPCVHDVSPELFYPSYIQTYLERDIRQITSVKDLTLFQRFVELIAGRVGGLLNLSEVARECGISHTSAQNWLSLLENSRIVYLLRPYFKNLSKRVVKSPKVYFTDTGLLAYLLKYTNADILAAGPMAGHIFENFQTIEFLKYKINYLSPLGLYFYRDSNKSEIDLIIESAHQFGLVEIKMRKNVSATDAKIIDKLNIPSTQSARWVLSCNERKMKITRKTMNLPWWSWRACLNLE